jgi:hypothetical protein
VSQGSRDLTAALDTTVVTFGAPPHAPGPSSHTPTSTLSLDWFASFTSISQDGFLTRRRGVISSDPDQIWLTSDAGEKIRSWRLDSIENICFWSEILFR